MNVVTFRRSEKDLDAAVMKALDQMGWFVMPGRLLALPEPQSG